jgi:penicillin-binding protein 1C
MLDPTRLSRLTAARCRSLWVLTAVSAGVLAIFLIALREWPHPSLRSRIATSTALSARGGELLRLTLAVDSQYRLWVSLEDMPTRLPAAVLLYEDRWFYRHPGVNPVALFRAAVADWRGPRRMGASTITMQLARRLYGLDTRSTLGKFRQIAIALWLEARYSKHDILEAYLNLTPYGGNVEGVGAASLIFFARRVADLSVPQIMALAVVPQNPRARRLTAAGDRGVTGLDDARLRLWTQWLEAHPADCKFSGEITSLQVKGPQVLPYKAPHFTDSILRAVSGDVRTTLDVPRQQTVERVLQTYVNEGSSIGIRNAAALLLEVDDGAARVRAYVGSANYWNTQISGQVNAVTAKRSPGSTLKPFVYALALDQGLLHPRSILKDTPSSFGPFSPENFDGRFAGPIAAEDALIRSRNVPAVAIESHLSHPNLYDFLKESEVSRLNSEQHYGLALTLGGGEVSMEELGRMYAVFVNGGRLPSLQVLATQAAKPAGAQLISPEASYITLDMLEKNPRPDTGQPAAPAVAWKTGTSWGFHDAWSVGVFDHYVLLVWIGNVDETSNPAFIGVQAAGPLLFRIIDSLRTQGLDPAQPRRPKPRNVTRVEVCAASGDLPNAECPQTVPTWYIPGKSPIRISDLHRRVYSDASGRVCGPGPGVSEQIYEFWSSDMLRLFREAGMPRRVPPPAPDCSEAVRPSEERDRPQIVSPLRGVVYTLRLSQLQPLALRANSAAAAQAVYWFADNAYLGRTPHGEALAWLPPQAGHFLLRAVDVDGIADSREVDVEVVP